MKRAPDWRKPAARRQFFFETNLFKEWIKKSVALLTKEKGKMAKNEWENDEAFLKGAAVFHDFPMTFSQTMCPI